MNNILWIRKEYETKMNVIDRRIEAALESGSVYGDATLRVLNAEKCELRMELQEKLNKQLEFNRIAFEEV